MKDATLVKTGIIGSVIAALCCFTPILVIGFGAVGLSAWLGWLDYVLLPVLGLFLGLTAWVLWRRHKSATRFAPEATPKHEGR